VLAFGGDQLVSPSAGTARHQIVTGSSTTSAKASVLLVTLSVDPTSESSGGDESGGSSVVGALDGGTLGAAVGETVVDSTEYDAPVMVPANMSCVPPLLEYLQPTRKSKPVHGFSSTEVVV
jgi:hypothetical protein